MEETLPDISRPITAKDWKEIEEKLMSFYSQVHLLCDGYKLTLVLVRLGQFKNAISVYVNGEIKGKWYLEDCEESRRFFCPHSKELLTAKEKAAYKKIYRSKKEYLKFVESRKYVYYQPHWKSFRSLKSHLTKNNKVIEIVITKKDGDCNEYGASD